MTGLTIPVQSNPWQVLKLIHPNATCHNCFAFAKYTFLTISLRIVQGLLLDVGEGLAQRGGLACSRIKSCRVHDLRGHGLGGRGVGELPAQRGSLGGLSAFINLTLKLGINSTVDVGVLRENVNRFLAITTQTVSQNMTSITVLFTIVL